MQTITALTAQKKKQDRVNVFLDGTFAFGLPISAALQLKVGQTLSPGEVAALQQEDLLDKAKQSAYRLLSYRPRSIAEVRRHLVRKGHEEELVNTAVAHLISVDLLNDETFTQYWIEQRESFKPRSHIALSQELRQKGISRTIIEKALENVDETAAARRAAEKKARIWTDLSSEEFRSKMGRFLQRRGFHYGIINQIITELWQSIVQEREVDNKDNLNKEI